MSKTYRPYCSSHNINKIWNDSYAHERTKLLKDIGITDKQLIIQLVNTQYVNLNSEVRFKLECP